MWVQDEGFARNEEEVEVGDFSFNRGILRFS